MPRSHRPPFTTAPVADSQRSADPLLFTTSARADSQRRWLPPFQRRPYFEAMDDPNDPVLFLFAVAAAAVMLVAGELCLATRSDPLEATATPPSVITSSIK